MTKEILKRYLGLAQMSLILILSVISLFFNDVHRPESLMMVYEFILYLIALLALVSLKYIFKSNKVVLLFFFCTLIPILNFNGSQDLMLGDRFRWLFYTSTILLVDIRNVRVWIKLLIGMMLIYIVSPIVFEPYFFPNPTYNTGWDYEIETFPAVLFFGGMFLFGIQQKLSIFRKVVIYTSLLSTLLFFLYYGRRVGPLLVLLFVMAPFFTAIGGTLSKIKVGLFSILVLLILSYFVYDSFGPVFFEKLSNRIDEDSRSEVVLLATHSLDVNNAWVMGLGVQGGYPNPIDHEISDTRTIIEVGMLDVIIDGGLLLWICLMILSIYAFYLGYVKSKNSLIRSFAYVALIYVVMQFPISQHGVTPYGYMIFSAIGFCFNKEYRECTDEEIFELIKL